MKVDRIALARLMIEHNITSAELSRCTGISKYCIGCYLGNPKLAYARKAPKLRNVIKLADFFKVDVNTLIAGGNDGR